MKKIVVGSRESRLAVVQSEEVVTYLKMAYPETDISLLTMKTTGDKILDRRLDQIGGKGLFVKELDKALMEGRTDISVHSLKDLPMEIPESLPLVCFSRREDPRDVLVLPKGQKDISEMDLTKPVGTSSLRRIIQLKMLHPDWKIASVRGNVQTRLRKLDEGQYGAVILAAAGLKRLGLEGRISMYFSPEEMIPAAGQAILAVQGRRDFPKEIFRAPAFSKGEDLSWPQGYADVDSADEAAAERGFVRYLNGGCSSPIAAHAVCEGGSIHIRGFYFDEDSKTACIGTIEGDRTEAEKLGCDLAAKLQAGEGKSVDCRQYLPEET